MMSTSGPRRTGLPEFRQPICHPIWGQKILRTIQGRQTLREKEIDLFKLRIGYHQKSDLGLTIIYVLKKLMRSNQLGFLAKSILVELGENIGPIEPPENIEGKQIYHLARLYLLSGKRDEAITLLAGRDLAEAAEVRLLLLKDPAPEVRNNVPFYSPHASR